MQPCSRDVATVRQTYGTIRGVPTKACSTRSGVPYDPTMAPVELIPNTCVSIPPETFTGINGPPLSRNQCTSATGVGKPGSVKLWMSPRRSYPTIWPTSLMPQASVSIAPGTSREMNLPPLSKKL